MRAFASPLPRVELGEIGAHFPLSAFSAARRLTDVIDTAATIISSSLYMTDLDFYRVTQGSFASYLYNNYTYNGVLYPSLVEIDWQYNGDYYSSIFTGSGILLDANKNIIAGTVSGYVEAWWNGSAWLELWP